MTYKKPIGHSKNFSEQEVDAKKQEGIDIAEFEKTVYAVFMHYVKTGERYFPRDASKDDYSLIRFKEKVNGLRLACGFGTSGLVVNRDYSDYGFGFVAVALARKSYGT